MSRFPIPNELRPVASILHGAGFRCVLVGGALRDMALGRPPGDFDLASDATPQDIIRLFRRVIPTGIRHGTVTILFQGRQYEITTFRVEGTYTDARRPDTVSYTDSLLEDLRRRDFTINAMALDLSTGEFVDPHGGIADISRRMIRAIGSAEDRLREDALRSVRACRFAAQLEFALDEGTAQAIEATLDGLAGLSGERIRDELLKILGARRPSIAFEIMRQTGMLPRLFPELAEGIGVEQRGMHRFDVYTHSILACDGAPREDTEIRLAALLHDIGKPQAKEIPDSGEPTFHGHEKLSEDMARGIMRRLRFSIASEERVAHLIRHHMFNYDESWTDAAVRRFLARVRPECVNDLFRLREADHYGMEGRPALLQNLVRFREHIERIRMEKCAFTLKDLAVNGNLLHEKAGIPKGPVMGLVLQQLLETVLDDPTMNREDLLVPVARNFYERHLNGSG